MNTTKHIAAYCSCSILACMLLASQSAYAGIAGRAQFVMGDVQIINAAKQARALHKGDSVNEGDTVLTGRGANAQIKMQDGGFVAVRPESQLRFDSFNFSGKEDGSEKLFFSLAKGGFRSVTGLIGRINKPSYRINTAAATIGIRGTDHETFVVTPDSQLANTAPTGTYNKVNVGETFMATEKGTIFVLPNQMGYASGMNQAPELKPLNTDIFTVADKPTKDAKNDEEDGDEVRETAAGDSAAEAAAAPATEAASYTTQGINPDIIQPITTEAVITLAGWTGPVAAYIPRNYLIEFASQNYYSSNFMVSPADITYVGGAPVSFIERDLVSAWNATYTVIGGTTPIAGTTISGATGIQFGRWTSATAIENSYTNQLGNTTWQTSSTWMYGTQGYLDAGITAANGQMYGTFNYTLDGSTAPRDLQSGQRGTLTGATISVDFVNSLFSANLALTVGGQAWSASATNVLFNGPTFNAYASPGGAFNNLTVSTGAGTPVACPSCGGNLSGSFTGQNYAGAILSYYLWDISNAGGNVYGEAAFARPTTDAAGAPINNGVAAPTGLYVIATDAGGGGIQIADTLSTTGGVLTSYSSGSIALNGFYSSTTVTCTTCTVAAPTANSANTGINYGTWDAGSLTNTYASSTGAASPLWITGPESGPLFLANALVGTKTFSFDGGMVTNSMGVPGTVLGTTALTVDFTRQVVGINLDLSIVDTSATPTAHTWNAATLPGNEAIISSNQGIGGATFYASNNLGATGPGVLTVTVDAGTVATTAGSGNISGQLTGVGFNGAILSYSLFASLPSPALTFEQVTGVTALVGPASDVATPYRAVLMSATDPTSIINVPTVGFYANAPSRMATDAAGNLTQFDMNFINNNSSSTTLSSGTSVRANAGSDALTGISWGRWDGGTINSIDRMNGTNTPVALAGSMHWIAAPTETTAVTLPVSGSYTYTNAGGTAPTDNLGNVGTLNSATLNADFTAQTVNIGVNVTVSGANLVASAANVPIIQQTVFYADSQLPLAQPAHLAVTCTGTCGTSAQGIILGEFTGAGATGAMMTYGLQNTSATGTQSISGVTAFHR